MLVTFMGVSEGMAKKGHANFAGNAELKQSGIEGVPQVVEPDIADSRSADGCFPAGLKASNWFAFKGEDQTGILSSGGKQSEHSCCQRDFASFSFRRLAVGDIQEPPFKVHVFPCLVQNLAPAHAGIESENRDFQQMGSCGRKELDFFREAEHRLLLAAFPFEPYARDGVRRENTLINRPIEQMAQALDVAVYRGFSKLLFGMPLFAVAPDQAFCNPADFRCGKERQEHFEPVAMPLLRRCLIEEPASEFRKEHLGFEVGELRRFEANFFLVLLVDLFCKPAVTGLRRTCMADAIVPDVTPVHIAALEKTHF